MDGTNPIRPAAIAFMSNALVTKLPKSVQRCIAHVDFGPHEDPADFAAVVFENGYIVWRRGDEAEFLAECFLVYDLPKVTLGNSRK